MKPIEYIDLLLENQITRLKFLQILLDNDFLKCYLLNTPFPMEEFMNPLINKESVIEKTLEGIEKQDHPKHKRLYTAQAQKVFAAIADKFGCNTLNVYELVKVMPGLDLPPLKDVIPVIGSMIVCLSNPNEHNYGIRKPFIVTDTDTGIMVSGEHGNHFPTEKRYWRYATPAEITKFFQEKRKRRW